MRVHRLQRELPQGISYVLLDDDEQPILAVSGFMRHLHACGFSPNTQAAYAYDLLHFMTFLEQHELTYLEFMPTHALDFLAYLRSLPSRRQAHRLSLVLCTTERGASSTHLAAATINRILAAVSSFYEYLILSGQLVGKENPLQKEADLAGARVSERHRPAMGQASRQRPIRRVVRVKTVSRVPRPMSEEQIAQLLGSLPHWRDKAMILLMEQGGLRPGDYVGWF